MKQESEQFKHDFLPLQPAMQHMAERILGNEDDAADVVQDCFVTLWNEREKLRQVVNREAWCIMLVKRRSIDLLRRRKPTVSIDEQTLTIAEDGTDSPDERLNLALKFISQLPERQATAIHLKHFDGLDTNSIASKLHISSGNVYTLLSRAYNSLKQMIDRYENK